MEYESAEPKVNGASVRYLMSQTPEVVRQLLQVNHRQGDVIGSWLTLSVLGRVKWNCAREYYCKTQQNHSSCRKPLQIWRQPHIYICVVFIISKNFIL